LLALFRCGGAWDRGGVLAKAIEAAALAGDADAAETWARELLVEPTVEPAEAGLGALRR